MGRQFHGILPMLNKVTNNTYSDQFLGRKDKEKEKFDMKHSRELKPLLVGLTVSYLNPDLKTWSVGVVISCSPDNGSYHIKTENDQVISCNRVDLCETNVEFVPQVQNIPKVLKEEKTVKSSSSNTKSKQSMQKQNIKSTVGSNGNYRTRSGHEVRKPPMYP